MAEQKVDLISQGVGSVQYLAPWYPEDLRIAIHGNLVKDPVRISRYYMAVSPQVAVDFEPDPRDERFYIDEKRQWCLAKGIVYVPVYLADDLSLDQFVERLKAETEVTKAGLKAYQKRKAAEAAAKTHTFLQDPEIVRWVDQEAARRVDQISRELNKVWRGMAKVWKIRAERTVILRELQERYPDGRVGVECRAQVSPDTARG